MKRPFGVTLLAVLGILSGVYGFVSGLLLIRRSSALMEVLVLNEPKTWGVLVVGAPCALGIIYTVIGIGLWRLRKWARRVFVAWCALAFAFLTIMLLWAQFRAELWAPATWPLLLSDVFLGLCVIYMLRPEAKQAFRG